MLVPSRTDHMVSLEDCIIIIKNVPCEECKQCGETFYSDEIASKLETILNKVKTMVSNVAVFEFDKVA